MLATLVIVVADVADGVRLGIDVFVLDRKNISICIHQAITMTRRMSECI